MTDIDVVPITSDMIRLGQFLKFAGLAESGAAAGDLVQGGDVMVDGEVETRRGRQLTRGMVVEVRLPGSTAVAKVG